MLLKLVSDMVGPECKEKDEDEDEDAVMGETNPLIITSVQVDNRFALDRRLDRLEWGRRVVVAVLISIHAGRVDIDRVHIQLLHRGCFREINRRLGAMDVVQGKSALIDWILTVLTKLDS